MRKLQRFLAIPMAASAVAAVWLLYRQAGSGGLVWAFAAVSILIVFLWSIGTEQLIGRAIKWPTFAFLAAMLVWMAVDMPVETPRGGKWTVAGAQPWSEAAVASDVAQGHPLFVYFTADWCLTCKVNEAGAIDRGEVREAFDKAGVKVLAGDWTNGDPAITRFLEAHGRAGVPFYLWYAPGREPEELPQVLTPGMLISRAQSAKR